MLTPAEISGKEFKRAVLSGYEMAGVDDFLEEVLGDYTALYKENGILKNKLKVLVEKIEEYRSTEDSMRMALLTAQKTGEELVSEARRRGAEIAERMEGEAAARRLEIETELQDERARLEAAAGETARFVSAARELISAQEDFLSKLSSIKHTPPPPVREPEPPRGAEGEAPAEPAAPGAEDEETSPRPKNKFDDLKFGINFENS
ncbi:MAG: DivIVA domain-containing protein [Oscillospiraceae bacterium]|jgi:cell division initiation protein|nr:DivIVA domain-containing protein [Oscillospiraceae bacterium]